ncbi:hypothetical protein [Amycolatopsis sp. NPDC059657]|uniref:hypothetical protein n=1 Tax=Amycolatopsis sp. NPDC059657 TaxID=3346899 RepID=UPI0036702471
MTQTRQWRQVAPEAWWRTPFVVGYSLTFAAVAVLGAALGSIQFTGSIATVAAIAYFHYRARTTGVYTSDSGVRLRGLARSRELGWAEVGKFVYRPSYSRIPGPEYGSLWVVLADGEELKTSVKVEPEADPAGKTAAILNELNRETRLAHAEMAAARDAATSG